MTTKICVFNTTSNLIDVTDGIAINTGSPANAGQPVVLNSEGQLDSSFFTIPITAYAAVNLVSGNFVNLYYGTIPTSPPSSPPMSGVLAQLASANSGTLFPAMGYVNATYSVGDVIEVYTTGLATVSFSSGFSPSDSGTAVYLSASTPGFITKTAPSSPNATQLLGYIYQVSGTFNSTIQFAFIPCVVGSSGGGGGVGSVGLSMPAEFSVAGSPVTSSGVFTVTLTTQTANTAFVDPVFSGGAAVPTFRALVSADLPVATSSLPGAVVPDNLTTAVSGGVISVPTATSSSLGVVTPDGTIITVLGGGITVAKATSSAFGVVQVDGTTISSVGGVITANAGTPAITQLTGDVTAGPGFGSQAASVVKVNGASLPISATIVGTNGSGQLIDASTASLSNNTTGTSGGLTGDPSITVGGFTLNGAPSNTLLKADGTGYATLLGEVPPTGTAPTTTYGLSHAPFFIFGVYNNGQFMYPGTASPPTYDYTVSGSDILFNYETDEGDVIYVVYLY